MATRSRPRVVGFQLWVALPPETELAEVDRQYLDASHIPAVGPARVILGSYGGVASPVRSTPGTTYLLVTLADGERWTFTPDADQTVAWLAVSHGAVDAGAPVDAGEVVVFHPGQAPITLTARGESRLVIGAAAPHPYPLITGSYSVHTRPDALVEGERTILAIRPRA